MQSNSLFARIRSGVCFRFRCATALIDTTSANISGCPLPGESSKGNVTHSGTPGACASSHGTKSPPREISSVLQNLGFLSKGSIPADAYRQAELRAVMLASIHKPSTNSNLGGARKVYA